jgi:hypothetical protein
MLCYSSTNAFLAEIKRIDLEVCAQVATSVLFDACINIKHFILSYNLEIFTINRFNNYKSIVCPIKNGNELLSGMN